MTNQKLIAGMLIAGLALEGCSSKPREFSPQLAAAPTSESQFDAAYAQCQQMYAAGQLDSNGRAKSAAVGVGAGAGTAAIGGATAAAVGGWGGVALASATVVLLPFAIVGGAWGMSRAKRAKKEHAIKAALQGCLHEHGYEVAEWNRILKHKAPETAPAGGQ